uniref:Uncharacterized protein n=1 Tax=Anguilla anguilla TaxID=7936 RepID=A0A0E9SQ21_ANGAN
MTPTGLSAAQDKTSWLCKRRRWFIPFPWNRERFRCILSATKNQI